MSLLSRFRRRTARAGVTCLEIGSGGIALAHVLDGETDAPQLAVCEYRPCEDAEAAAALASAVRDHGLEGARCFGVLPRRRYDLRLLDAPDVEPDEMRAAARWLVKDLIDFPLEQAVVDHFEVPEQHDRGRQSRIYVVTARADAVEPLVAAALGADLDLEVVDVSELALRNLASRLPEDEQGVALLRLGRRSGLLTLTHAGSLYLARSLESGSEDLQDVGAEEPAGLPLDDELEAGNQAFDVLVLEIQRCLDYYESQLGQPPVASLRVAPLEQPVPGLVPHLEKHLNASVRGLDLGAVVEGAAGLPESLQARCLAAIGAGLRRELDA